MEDKYLKSKSVSLHFSPTLVLFLLNWKLLGKNAEIIFHIIALPLLCLGTLWSVPVNMHHCLQQPAAKQSWSHFLICVVMLMHCYNNSTNNYVEVDKMPSLLYRGNNAFLVLLRNWMYNVKSCVRPYCPLVIVNGVALVLQHCWSCRSSNTDWTTMTQRHCKW